MFEAVMHAIFVVMMVTSVSTEYDFKCAHESQRKIRANWYCNATEGNYSCLLDFSHDSYKESCSYTPDFVRMGQKYVIKGSKRNINCSSNSYQPFKFYSSKHSKCAFLKSSCTEEGQFVLTHGYTMEDSKCRCDYTKGYTFLVRPRNNRFCKPDQEDCTCYTTTCPRNSVLTSDYECTRGHIPPSISSAVVQAKSNQNEAVKSRYWDSFTYNVALPTTLYKTVAAAASTTCLLSLVVVALVVYRYHHLLMDCTYKDGDEIDGYRVQTKEGDTNEGEYDKKAEPVGLNYCQENSTEKLIVQPALRTKDEDAAPERVSAIIGALEKIIQKFNSQYRKSIFQFDKSKWLCHKKVLRFLEAVFDIVKEKNEINLVEGVRLIKIITDTCKNFSKDDSVCMQLPLEFLEYIWNKRVDEIKEDDKAPRDLNLEIVAIQNNFKSLDKNQNENEDIFKQFTKKICVSVDNLQQTINNLINSKVTCTDDEVMRVTHKSHTLICLYMNVQFLRSVYCIRYYTHEADYITDKLHLMYTELNTIEDSQKQFLEVFSKPTTETVAFFALFHPSEYQFFKEYMTVKEIKLQDLSKSLHDQRYAMRSQKWPEYWANMSNTMDGTIWSTKATDDTPNVLFKFELTPKGDNIFLISSNRWKSWYMYMNDASSVRGQNKKKSHKREWKILRLKDGTYMMCTRKWPSKFIYMDDGVAGKVCAAYGDPRDNGRWNLIHENELNIK